MLAAAGTIGLRRLPGVMRVMLPLGSSLSINLPISDIMRNSISIRAANCHGLRRGNSAQR